MSNNKEIAKLLRAAEYAINVASDAVEIRRDSHDTVDLWTEWDKINDQLGVMGDKIYKMSQNLPE